MCDGVRSGLGNLPADTVFGVAPHSLRAVAPHSLSLTRTLANGGPFHMHLAEQRAESRRGYSSPWRTPVEWVLNNFDVDPDLLLPSIARKCDPMKQSGLAASGAIAGLCPITEASLGDGIFDGVGWFEAGGIGAIGSDSIFVFHCLEVAGLEYSQRLRDQSRAALATSNASTGRRMLDNMITGGARAAGRPYRSNCPRVLGRPYGP